MGSCPAPTKGGGQILGADHGMDVDSFGRAKFMDGVSRSARKDLFTNPRLGPLGALHLLRKDTVPNPNAVEIAIRALVTAHPDGEDLARSAARTQFGHRVARHPLVDLCLLVGVRGGCSPNTRSRSAT